jgi:hypothetical protein
MNSGGGWGRSAEASARTHGGIWPADRPQRGDHGPGTPAGGGLPRVATHNGWLFSADKKPGHVSRFPFRLVFPRSVGVRRDRLTAIPEHGSGSDVDSASAWPPIGAAGCALDGKGQTNPGTSHRVVPPTAKRQPAGVALCGQVRCSFGGHPGAASGSGDVRDSRTPSRTRLWDGG